MSTEGWKVIRAHDRSSSSLVLNNKDSGAVIYRCNENTYPVSGKGPLVVFTLYSAARDYRDYANWCPMLICGCIYQPSQEKSVYISILNKQNVKEILTYPIWNGQLVKEHRVDTADWVMCLE